MRLRLPLFSRCDASRDDYYAMMAAIIIAADDIRHGYFSMFRAIFARCRFRFAAMPCCQTAAIDTIIDYIAAPALIIISMLPLMPARDYFCRFDAATRARYFY